jgi:hypothetical protein
MGSFTLNGPDPYPVGTFADKPFVLVSERGFWSRTIRCTTRTARSLET